MAWRRVGGVKAGELFDANLDLAGACRDHPFVQGIASGRLDRASFCYFVGQDARPPTGDHDTRLLAGSWIIRMPT